jgi:YVTN family beta-propeller protein
MKVFLIMIFCMISIPIAADASSNTNSTTNEQISEFGDQELFNSQIFSDPRVKILDFEGLATSGIVNEKTNTVYVTDFYFGKLHFIDGNTDEIIETIKVVSTPFGVGINPETNLLYVGGEHSNILSIINATTRQVVSNISLEDPYDIAVNPANNMIYVTSDKSNSVHVIDGKTNEIVTSFEVINPCGIAVNSETGVVYVTSASEDVVKVFDGNTNEFVTTINVPVGEIPRRIVVNPQTNTIFVTNQGSEDISVIDGHNNEIIETIKVSEPFEMTINSQTNKVYAMYHGSDLTVISYDQEFLPVLQPPLKQVSLGVNPNSVVCKTGFELVLKEGSDSPACVKPTTAEKLIQRGWARE